ncbi:YcxB family protein [Altererythrobacter sp. BO-6]|uniref:YcxB family protein n=1 Tax=Altererythrobacter sp. BO-6 TaxID=2604537 RepID=UPI0013E133D9|nr:YcxB family protein [Altererythrobacter sp. BO-6]QIG52819.1 YcxB family protein [Altererythrobacter sp. BO-6]
MTNRTATFTLNEGHALGAMKLVMNRRTKIPVWPVVVFGPLIAVVFLLYKSDGPFSEILPILGWLVIVLSGLVAIAYYWALPRQVRRSFRQTAMLQEPMTIEWDEAGYALSSASGNARLNWDELYAWAEQDDIVLLMQSEMLYNLVPKAALSADQLGSLRSCLAHSGLKQL